MHRHEFHIDKITNSIEDAATGKSLETEVIPITPTDLKTILKKTGWRFNWKSEFKHQDRQLYKLIVKRDTAIQGLISLQPAENYIEMHLIETAPHNYGKSKKYIGVPGNLVAFACRMSFDSGFEGFVNENKEVVTIGYALFLNFFNVVPSARPVILDLTNKASSGAKHQR